jgi:hypothetical protein
MIKLDEVEYYIENDIENDIKEQKFITYENGLQCIESDNEVVDEDIIYNMTLKYGDIANKALLFHKYTNIEVDDYLDYLREISLVYFTSEERSIISVLYSRFRKRNICPLLKSIFDLLEFIRGKNKKKIALYFLYYIISRTIPLLHIEDTIKLYLSSYNKIIEFKIEESIDFSEFIMFDNRIIPKIENVLGIL